LYTSGKNEATTRRGKAAWADIVAGVIHGPSEAGLSRSKVKGVVVNNCAVWQNRIGESPSLCSVGTGQRIDDGGESLVAAF